MGHFEQMTKPAGKRFVQLVAESMDATNYRSTPSSRFRWAASIVYRGGGLAHQDVPPRYYKTKQLAEAYAKANFSMYLVGKVKGFV